MKLSPFFLIILFATLFSTPERLWVCQADMNTEKVYYNVVYVIAGKSKFAVQRTFNNVLKYNPHFLNGHLIAGSYGVWEIVDSMIIRQPYNIK